MVLVTSCPGCKTTFRISVGILEKAGGQVRCGRCASIFDANVDLREIDERDVITPSKFKFELAPDQDDAVAQAEGEAAAEPAEVTETPPAEQTAEDGVEGESEGEGDSEPEPGDSDDTDVETLTDDADWLPEIEESRPERVWLSTAAAAVLGVALVLQVTHHFRASLVTLPQIGPAIAAVYGVFGQTVLPAVDLGQFNLLDLTAVAETSDDSAGWLVIETRVHNAGPKVQAYPHIFVRLLDRWGETIAGRYFDVGEYAVTPISDKAQMDVGSRIDAQFVIVDPGPSATGFELELCSQNENGFACESDFARQ